MEMPLYIVIGLLSVAICALAGFWFYRAARANKAQVKPQQIPRRAAKKDPWSQAMRATRDKI